MEEKRQGGEDPIDREQVLVVNPAQLPPDAEFKGYEAVVVQDIRIWRERPAHARTQ